MSTDEATMKDPVPQKMATMMECEYSVCVHAGIKVCTEPGTPKLGRLRIELAKVVAS